jgi:hypothetical protein
VNIAERENKANVNVKRTEKYVEESDDGTILLSHPSSRLEILRQDSQSPVQNTKTSIANIT